MNRSGQITHRARGLRPVLAAVLGLLAMVGVMLLSVAPSLAVMQVAPCHEAILYAGADQHGAHGLGDVADDASIPFKPAASGATCPVLAGFALPDVLPVPDRLPVWSAATFIVAVHALTPALVDGPGRPPPAAV
jgi:hypothetical protein